MATKIQLRRGLASSWTFENPVLSSGEIGLETDTNKFKIGDGITLWNSLNYFAIPFINSASSSLVAYVDSRINSLIDASPATLDTLNELAAAINDDPNFFTNITNSIVTASAAAYSTASANTLQQINSASTIFLTPSAASAQFILQNATGNEYIQDTVAPLFVHGFHTNLTASYDDTNNRIRLNAAAGGDLALSSDLEIIPLDDLQPLFDGKENRFLPTYQSASIAITNPLKLMISINGIIQSVDFPETVWQSMMPRRGFRIDNEGYIAFAEPVPIGATFDARILAGPSTTTRTRIYPFKAIDIYLGG
jgi:hypothetical protein